jgi:hypothetical protein
LRVHRSSSVNAAGRALCSAPDALQWRVGKRPDAPLGSALDKGQNINVA